MECVRQNIDFFFTFISTPFQQKIVRPGPTGILCSKTIVFKLIKIIINLMIRTLGQLAVVPWKACHLAKAFFSAQTDWKFRKGSVVTQLRHDLIMLISSHTARLVACHQP